MPTARRLPRRRPDLVVRPIGDRGRFVVKDPRSGAYFQIGRQEQFLLTSLDGKQSAAAVHRAFEAEFGEPLSDADLDEFLELARTQQLLAPLAADAPPEARPRAEAPPARPPAYRSPVVPPPDDARPDAITLPALMPAAGPGQNLDFWRNSLFDPSRANPPAADTPSEARRRLDALLGRTTDDVWPAEEAPPAAAPAAAPAAPSPAEQPAPPAPGPTQSLLYWRKSLFDPDRLFDRLLPWIGFIWTPAFAAAALAGVLAALWVLVANWADLGAGFSGAVRWETVALVWVTVLAVTTLHEFAHGLTLKRFGGEVHEIGLLVMYFVPCLFCNVSDAWLVQERWKRMLVTLAGGLCDLILWAVAVLVWRLTPLEGLPNYLAFVAMTVLGARVFLNFNPFLKLDGYYLLSDWLEVPNLLVRGQDRAKAHLRRLLWGAPPPADPQGRVLTAYGLASWLYGITFLSLGVYGLVRFLWGWFGPIGIAAAFGLAAFLVRNQFKGLSGGETAEMVARRPVRTAIWLALLAAAGWLATMPISDRAGGAFRVRAGARAELRAPATAVLREVLFAEGETVPAGAVVARLEVPDLVSRQACRRAEAAEARAKLLLLEAGPSPAKVAELTERTARAARWHALAEEDLARDRTAHQQELARLDAQVARFEAEVRQSTSAHDRVQPLRLNGAVSADEWEVAVARLATSRGQLAQAVAERQVARTRGSQTAETELARRAKELADAAGELAVLKAGPRPEEVAAARAVLARAEEESRYLDELGGKLTIRAERGGQMMTPRSHERVGRLFQEGELVCEVEDNSGLEAEILLRESQAARVEPGQQVEIVARAFPFQTMSGQVRCVAPAARRPGERPDQPLAAASAAPTAAPEGEGQVAITCTLSDCGVGLRPGMTGYARITRGERSAAAVFAEGLVRTVRIEYWR